eukprot:symbB.v1.2.002827.t1/scaffold144.1/size299099/5
MVVSPADRLQEEGLLARVEASESITGMDGSGSLPPVADHSEGPPEPEDKDPEVDLEQGAFESLNPGDAEMVDSELLEDQPYKEEKVVVEESAEKMAMQKLPVPSPEVSLEKEVSSGSMYSMLAQSSNATPHKPDEQDVRWSTLATEESSELAGSSPAVAKDLPPDATDIQIRHPDLPDASEKRHETAQEEAEAMQDILEWEANVKDFHACGAGRQRNQMTSNATWFMDAAAQGGGTPAGTGKVITQGLFAQPEDVRPAWMKGRSQAEVCEIVTRSICEAVEASYVVKEYLDQERSKGRKFDDIYTEVQPYLERISRPLDDAAAAELVDPRFNEGTTTFQEEAARREAFFWGCGMDPPSNAFQCSTQADRLKHRPEEVQHLIETSLHGLPLRSCKTCLLTDLSSAPESFRFTTPVETDAALRKAKKDSIWEDLPAKAQWQATNVDGQTRKVTSAEPRQLREGAEDALWDEVAGAKVGSDVVTDVNEVPEAHKKHMADSEKEKGNEAFYSKDYQEAEAYYSRSLQYMADDPSTWANRALVRLKLEQAQGALEDCEHALALNSSHIKALHRKGKALYELQRYKDAVRTFQEALLLSPGNSQINGDLMVARRKLRDDEAPPEPNGTGLKQLADAPSIAAVPLQSGYTRVQIEEDSESEEEEKPATAGKIGNGGFVKIAIEEAR